MIDNLPVWQSPPDFAQVASNVPGISVYAPRPKVNSVDALHKFNCPRCGAVTKFDVAAAGVACEHCGYQAPTQVQQVGLQAGVMEFTLETLSKAELGWGAARKEMLCSACGAELTIPENSLTSTCPFCASNRVNVRTAPVEQLRPRYLVPFKIEPQTTHTIAQAWLKKGWYHPAELGSGALLDRFNGVYLPFWTFSASISSDWNAEVGYEVEERYYDDGEKTWKTRTRIDWRWEDGRVEINVSDLLVGGSSHINQRILKKLYPFNLSDLVSYAPDFLAGWQAQTYDHTLPAAWEEGKAEMRNRAKSACNRDINSSYVRNFSMTADFADESWRYILLPVYIAAYQFDSKPYQVMINGQTGVIAGQKPVAWWKIWWAVAAMLFPGLCLGLIGLPLLLAAGVGSVPLGIGAILLIAGLIGSFILYQKAASEAA